MADKKSLFIYSDSSNSQINTVNLTDDSVSLISSGLTSMYAKGNSVVKSDVLNFLDSADGEKFFLLDLD